MDLIIGKNSGFCFGVKRAVDGIENDCKKYGKIKCLGEIVHNETVVESLEGKGVTFIDSINEVNNNDILAIRAHGVPKDIYDIARYKNLKIRDYTCPKVAKIHEQIKEAQESGYDIILIGKKSHPEVIGSKSYAEKVYLIEDIEEIEALPELGKVFSIVQTTFSMKKYKEIKEKLKLKYNNIKFVDSICLSTKSRQEECADIAKKVQFMIIIGGKNSSNTKKLYEVACLNCENCIIIQDEYDKKIEECKKYGIIGIMSGASTPINTIQKVADRICNLN